MVLAAFIGQISYCWENFLSYMSQDCLFNIRIKLILVEVGIEDWLIGLLRKYRRILVQVQVHETA